MILAILVGSQLGIILVKSESKWPRSLGGVSIDSKLFMLFIYIFSSGSHFVHWSVTIFAILAEGPLSNIPMKFE